MYIAGRTLTSIGPVLQPRSKNYIAYFWDLDYYIVPKLKEKICGLHGLSRARIIWGWLPEDGFHSGWHFGIHLEFSFARNIQPDDLAVQFDDVGQVEPADLVAPEDGKISIDMPFYDGEVEELEVRP